MALSKTPPERTELRNLRGCIPDHVGGVGWRVCTGLLDEFLVQHPRIEHNIAGSDTTGIYHSKGQEVGPQVTECNFRCSRCHTIRDMPGSFHSLEL